MRDKLNNILDDGACISEEMMLNYVERKLNPSDQHRVEKHLLGCELCRDALEGLSRDTAPSRITNLDALNQKIDARIQDEKGKVIPLHRLYRIAAIVALVALVGGGLYYLQSVKKSERVFTENFEPYRDTVHPASPVVATSPQEAEKPRQTKYNTIVSTEKAGQKISGADKKDVSGQGMSAAQTGAAERNEPMSILQKKSPNAVDAENKKEQTLNALPAEKVENDEPEITLSESTEKKTQADESKAGDVPAKNAQPVTQSATPFSLNKSAAKENLSGKTAAPTPVPGGTSSDNSMSGSGEWINEGKKQYEEKNYSAAISVFQLVLSREPANAEALFYSGISHLSINQDDVAINLLESILKNPGTKFSDAAKWYLSLAYIKKNKSSKAKKLLEDLSGGNSEFKSNALKALEELK